MGIVNYLRKFINPEKKISKNVCLGKSVSLSSGIVFFKTAPIIIGDHAMIACNVIIHTSTHDYNCHPMWLKRIDRPVSIGRHVWIGAGAIILPGIIVEDYAVVGAGSVVTAHVPKGAIVAGNPARIIKFRDLREIDGNDNVPDYSDHSTVLSESYLNKDKICKQLKKIND